MAILDAVRPGPTHDATAVTAEQLRTVVDRLISTEYWRQGDPDIVVVMDAGYDVTRLAHVLADLPVELIGRIRADRVLRLPKPARAAGTNGRPPEHGPEFALDAPDTWRLLFIRERVWLKASRRLASRDRSQRLDLHGRAGAR